MGTELTEGHSNVPALYDPSTSIDADDIEFPRLYIAQGTHGFVQAELVRRGSLVLATSGDDPDPVVLAQPNDPTGINFLVLALRKSKSISVNGELVRFNFNDPDVPPEAWTVYTYFIALPGIEDDVPVKWILTRSAKPAAQKINTVLARTAGQQPSYMSEFNLTTAERHDVQKGHRWHVPRVKPVEPIEGDVAIAAELFKMVNVRNTATVADSDPAI